VENYFNYFTEIEEHYLRRRGTHLLLSTLDWALIEIWKNAGVPLEAVLRGIDDAFDKYDQRPSKSKKVNSLAYCSQAVLTAAEDMKEAAVGATREERAQREPGFEAAQIAAFLRANADKLENAKLPERTGFATGALAREEAGSLREMAEAIERNGNDKLPRLEDLERRLTVLEEKLFAVLMAATPDEDLVNVRAEADRDIAPYRRNMTVAQVEQLHKQYVHKRLLERCGVPRLSLFYMH
jgi:adenine-specific DNA methylase